MGTSINSRPFPAPPPMNSHSSVLWLAWPVLDSSASSREEAVLGSPVTVLLPGTSCIRKPTGGTCPKVFLGHGRF